MLGNSGEGWSAFIRLLLTQESANPSIEKSRSAFAIPIMGAGDSDDDDFDGKKSFLYSVLETSAEREDFKFYFLGDILYAWMPTQNDMIDFCQRLRARLLVYGYYFKGVIRPGKIKALDLNQTLREAKKSHDQMAGSSVVDDLNEFARFFDEKTVNRTIDRAFGFVFDQSVLQLHSLEEQFKGIGFSVDVSAQDRGASIVSSAYPGGKKGEHFVASFDLAFPADEVGKPTISLFVGDDKAERMAELGLSSGNINNEHEKINNFHWISIDENGKKHYEDDFTGIYMWLSGIVRNFMISSTKLDVYSRYYVSLFITIIRSSDFSSISNSPSHGWQAFPVIFDLLRHTKILRQTRRYPGFDLVAGVLAEEVFIRHTMSRYGHGVNAPSDETRRALVSLLGPVTIRRLMTLDPRFLDARVRDDLASLAPADSMPPALHSPAAR